MLSKNLDHYPEIKLEDKQPFNLYSCRENSSLGYLSTVNIFVGQNNSGKSRLLRALFALDSYNFTLKNFNAKILFDFLEDANMKLQREMHGFDSIGGISKRSFVEIGNFDHYFIDSNNKIGKAINDLLNLMLEMDPSNIVGYSSARNEATSRDVRDAAADLASLARTLKINFDKLNQKGVTRDDLRYYFPVLRGMRSFDGDTDYFYRRTLSDYFDNLTDNKTVFSGLALYKRLKELLLGEPEDRKLVKDYESFLSSQFFESKSITLIPREGKDVVYVKLGDEKQLPIYNLGDGLQNLIIITFPIFTSAKRSLFFIEEPDLYMHPGLQRKLLETLLKNNKHQYFLTTHSNHFLDMTLDYSELSVFHFEKTEGEESKYKVSNLSEPNSRILRDLGVMNSSVFLSNATIWVEGITDRLYLKTYMKKYLEILKFSKSDKFDRYSIFLEDLHYSFVEYQGANLTHWNFDGSVDSEGMKVDYLSAKAIVIADGDIKNKGERVDILQGQLGNRFFMLDVKEIENLIPQQVLREILSKEFSNFGKDINSIKFSDYSEDGIAIGKYIDKKLGLKVSEGKFSEKSGTIKQKLAFCRKAVSFMEINNTWSINSKIELLCEAIFAHIDQYNHF